MTAALSKRSQNKTKKTSLTTVAISTDQCTAIKGRECPGSEKTALNKQREELVSQNKTVI